MTVSYSLVRQWHGRFEGELTIVNDGAATISAWEIAITLPMDQVLSVRDAVAGNDGDVLTLQPTSSDPSIPPGGELSIHFIAKGPTTSPASCTYDGAACA